MRRIPGTIQERTHLEAFGAPTGAAVCAMGFTHFDFESPGIRAERIVIDETVIWKQIQLQTGVCE